MLKIITGDALLLQFLLRLSAFFKYFSVSLARFIGLSPLIGSHELFCTEPSLKQTPVGFAVSFFCELSVGQYSM